MLLGPPYSEKTALLRDIVAELRTNGVTQPIYIDLWQARTEDEPYSSPAWRIYRARTEPQPIYLAANPCKPRAFQNFLADCLPALRHHLTLLFDHLHALPDDLVHSLLLTLRAVHNERNLEEGPQLTVLVTGGTNLANFSSGPTSPFNIAKAVRVKPLDAEQSRELAIHTWAGTWPICIRGRDHRIAGVGRWRSLFVAAAVRVERRGRGRAPTPAGRRGQRCGARPSGCGSPMKPSRLFERPFGSLKKMPVHCSPCCTSSKKGRWQSRQRTRSITRTGVTRLQLCGAVELVNGRYRIKNEAFREALRAHFQPERVSQVLRMTGRWREAIDYLAPRLRSQPLSSARRRPAGSDRPIHLRGHRDE